MFWKCLLALWPILTYNETSDDDALKHNLILCILAIFVHSDILTPMTVPSLNKSQNCHGTSLTFLIGLMVHLTTMNLEKLLAFFSIHGTTLRQCTNKIPWNLSRLLRKLPFVQLNTMFVFRMFQVYVKVMIYCAAMDTAVTMARLFATESYIAK